MTEFIWKWVHMSGHDGMMIFDDSQNTCHKSVVTYFMKNSNDFEHFHQNHQHLSTFTSTRHDGYHP